MLSRQLILCFLIISGFSCSQVFAQHPEKARQYFEKGLKQEKQGHYKSALEQFEKAISAYPEYYAPYYNRGVLHRKLGRFSEAEGDFTQALALYPGHREAHINRAMVRHHLADWEGAIFDYSEALSGESDAAVYALRAATLAASGRSRQALFDYNEAIRLKPQQARYYHLRGLCHLQLKEFEEAIEDQSRALVLDSTLQEAYYARGEGKYYKGEYEAALLDLSQGFPSPQYLRVRGDVNVALGRIDAAREDYNRAIRLDRDEILAFLGRARLKADQGDIQGAINDCDRALDSDPLLLEAYGLRGMLREQAGDLEGAEADLLVWLDRYPKDSAALFAMGSLYMKSKKWVAAREYLDRALTIQPEWAQAHYLRGLARFMDADFPAALEDFDYVVAHDKTQTRVFSYRSQVLLKLGKKQEARVDAQKATTLNPDWAHAYLSRALVFLALEMREPACVDLEQALSLDPDAETASEADRLEALYCK